MKVRSRLRHSLSPASPLGKFLRLAKIASQPVRMHDVIHREALTKPQMRFVQIGANDGVVADPLHPFIQPFGWSGAMVEPQPYVFSEKLEPLYRHNEMIRLVNAAIGPETGTMQLFILSFSNERWATGKASLKRSVLQEHVDSGVIEELARAAGVELPPEGKEWITSIDVPVMTVDELLEAANIDDFDLLHVDTEGADGMIVRQFDFSALSVRIVQFEHAHLSDTDFESTCQYLHDAKFQIYLDKMDVLATREIAIGRTSMKHLNPPWQRV